MVKCSVWVRGRPVTYCAATNTGRWGSNPKGKRLGPSGNGDNLHALMTQMPRLRVTIVRENDSYIEMKSFNLYRVIPILTIAFWPRS